MDSNKARNVIAHEIKEFLVVFLFVVAFFLAFTTYRLYLTGGSGDPYFDYGAALVSALVLSKVILIGEVVRLGRRLEPMPLVIPAIYKAALFTVFYLVFHAVEEIVRALVHGTGVWNAVRAEVSVENSDIVVRALIFFFAFIPFFGLRETQRVMGVDGFELFFGKRRQSSS